MKNYFDVLARCPLFLGIHPCNFEAMLKCLGTRVVEVKKGNTIFLEGDPAKFVGVVLSGSVQVVRDDYFGTRSVLLAAESGELFAEIFSCSGIEVLPVSVIALQDSTVMLMDCRKILTVCSNTCSFHQQLITNLLQAMAYKNMILSQKIQFMSKKTTKEKVMAYLLDYAKKHKSAEFCIPYDRQALADYLGVERSAMSAEISKLKKNGIIECSGPCFRIIPKKV